MSEQLNLAIQKNPVDVRLDDLIARVLRGTDGWLPNSDQVFILRVLWNHRSAKDPIKLAHLAHLAGVNERECKDLVRSLVVDFKVPIGARRAKPYGYYLICTADEARAAASAYIGEIRELGRRVRTLLGNHSLVELLGQLQVEFNDSSERGKR